MFWGFMRIRAVEETLGQRNIPKLFKLSLSQGTGTNPGHSMDMDTHTHNTHIHTPLYNKIMEVHANVGKHVNNRVILDRKPSPRTRVFSQ